MATDMMARGWVLPILQSCEEWEYYECGQKQAWVNIWPRVDNAQGIQCSPAKRHFTHLIYELPKCVYLCYSLSPAMLTLKRQIKNPIKWNIQQGFAPKISTILDHWIMQDVGGRVSLPKHNCGYFNHLAYFAAEVSQFPNIFVPICCAKNKCGPLHLAKYPIKYFRHRHRAISEICGTIYQAFYLVLCSYGNIVENWAIYFKLFQRDFREWKIACCEGIL